MRAASPWAHLFIWLGVAAAASACDTVGKLRAFFHEPSPQEETAADAATPAPPPARAGIWVEVTPPEGISILLDGVKVATRSPYQNDRLQAGPHTLHVRGMGHYPITLPVELSDDELLRVPVSLRPRPPLPMEPEVEPLPPASRAFPSAAELLTRPPLPTPPPPPQPQPLPPGSDPVELQVMTQPAVPLRVDEQTMAGRVAILKHMEGTLVAGDMELGYQVGPLGVLQLAIASDDATWEKDGAAIEPGATFRLNRGVTRITRVTAGGIQTLILRRK